MNQGLLTVCVSLCCFLLTVDGGAAERGGEPMQEKELPALLGPLDPMVLAITVDDLPATGELLPDTTQLEIARHIITALHTSQVPAVYGFSNGERLTWDPSSLEVLQAWLAAGNLLGNHTFSHPDLAHTTAEAYIIDLAEMDRVLATVSPASSAWKVFRYPFLSEGETLAKRNTVRDYLSNQGYRIAQVTVDYDDWAWGAAYRRCVMKRDEPMLRRVREQVVQVVRRELRRAQKRAKLVSGRDIPHILLVHMNAFTALTLPEILATLKADGVTFIDLQTAMSDPIYSINPNLPFPDSKTFLDQLVQMKGIDDPYQQTYSVEQLEEICQQ
jgi:peptidoglycan/xylan/chitin deacetylase (PgdA/CDA1 family)